ncbi:hypothetical protein BGI32_03675 [Snodgrassella alvi]|uniref:Uncharacterized protein n=1 Tax=Snodgrassella alvi TaxID=1196083 RepID=A0A2N9WVD4_9NEIS|nr:hypothetical protein [Snodgrassella alvi]PIT16919.1 hypothetical protein BGI32_03675 [Snodgrassella alvi]
MDSNIQNVIDDIYTVTKHRLEPSDPLVKVLHSSLFIPNIYKYSLKDVLKKLKMHCPAYAQLNDEQLSMLSDILHMQIKRYNSNNSVLKKFPFLEVFFEIYLVGSLFATIWLVSFFRNSLALLPLLLASSVSLLAILLLSDDFNAD